jgi:hypothetical protein
MPSAPFDGIYVMTKIFVFNLAKVSPHFFCPQLQHRKIQSG